MVMAVAPKKEPVKKNPVGRPTKYKPEYCEKILELAKEGKGWVSWALACGVDRPTLYAWGDQHPEFLTALKEAKLLEQLWWEEVGRSSVHEKHFQSVIWRTSMQARFREDYTERKVQEVTGKDGGAIRHEHKATIDLSVLDSEQREKLRELLTLAKKGK